MIQNLFILGATGKVGSTLVRQIFEKDDIDSNIHANPTRIVGLASSKEYVFMPDGISRQQAYDFTERRSAITLEYENLNQLLNIVNDGNGYDHKMLVFIDVTAVNEPMVEFHLDVIRKTHYALVTANKNPIALSDYDTFRTLTKKLDRYGYRCSVMAGAEAVTFLRDLKDVNDQPKSIQGCFSGTLGYIASELEKGRKFSEIILEARNKGYTEPDPRDDLNGLDVAGKDALAIASSGRTLDDYVNLSQYTIPEKLARMYELSKDVRYQNALKKMGDAILKDVDFSKGREVYRQGEYGEYKDMAILASKGLPYVYKGTGDAKYEAAYMSFFETSDIVQFSPSLLNAQYLVGPVLASAEALSYLSREETDPAKAAKYENDARLMLQAVLAAHFDGSERPLWDGGNSILIRSDATPGRDEDPNSRYKATNENGRIAQLLLVSFGDTAFNLPM